LSAARTEAYLGGKKMRCYPKFWTAIIETLTKNDHERDKPNIC